MSLSNAEITAEIEKISARFDDSSPIENSLTLLEETIRLLLTECTLVPNNIIEEYLASRTKAYNDADNQMAAYLKVRLDEPDFQF